MLGFLQFPCTARVDLLEAVHGAELDLPIFPGPGSIGCCVHGSYSEVIHLIHKTIPGVGDGVEVGSGNEREIHPSSSLPASAHRSLDRVF